MEQALSAGGEAALTVWLPGIDVLPEKKAHVTPSGRLSTKAWTKTEQNEMYANLLGGHLLATIREAWAVAGAVAAQWQAACARWSRRVVV